MQRPATDRGSRPLFSRLLLTLGLAGLVLSALGAAAYATFTSSTNVNQTIDSGTVAFASISTNGAGQRLSVAATNIAPGDTMQRAVTLTNTGTIDMATGSVALTSTASPSSLLDSGANGLTMVIERCSVAWTEAGPPYTYTCSGTTTSVLTTGSVLRSATVLSNIVTTAGTPNHLRVALTLPSAADNTYQGLTSTINYLFVGQQRAASNR